MSLRYCAHNAASKIYWSPRLEPAIVVPHTHCVASKNQPRIQPCLHMPTYKPTSADAGPSPMRMPVTLPDVWMFWVLHLQIHQGVKPAITTPLAGIGLEFSSTSTFWQPACSYFAPRACSSRFSSLQACWRMRTQAPFCTHSELYSRAHRMSFGLSMHSQTECSPWVCLLCFAHKSRCASGAGSEQQGSQDLLCWSLSILLLQVGCTFLWATEALYLSWLISQLVKGRPPRVMELLFFHYFPLRIASLSKLLIVVVWSYPVMWWSFLQL